MKAKDHLLMAYAHVQQLWPIGVLINLWGPTGPMHLRSHAWNLAPRYLRHVRTTTSYYVLLNK